MVAPGENLEFGPSSCFEKRCAPVQGLKNRIVEHLQNRPDDGETLFHGIRKAEVEFEGLLYMVFYRRVRNKIGLMSLFKAQGEQKEITAYVEELGRFYS